LKVENVVDDTILPVGPKMRAGAGIDQLARDAPPLTASTNAAFEDVAYAEIAAHLPHVDRAAPAGEGRVVGGDEPATARAKVR
jgi:hypothetical protein